MYLRNDRKIGVARLALVMVFTALMGQPNSAKLPAAESFPVVNFCKLIREASNYDGKTVAVKATYRYGFEWQELYCLGCPAAPKVWLEFSPDSIHQIRKALAGAPRHQGTLNGTFYGVFQSTGGPFGDGGYKYRVNLQRATDVKVVSKSGGVPSSLPASVKEKVCGGGNQAATPEHEGVHAQ